MKLDATELRYAYRQVSLAEARVVFEQSAPCNPKKYFNILDGYLTPYRGFVNALFTKPDLFDRFPYTHQVPPASTHPIIENFQDCHRTYQSHMSKLHASYGLAGEAIELSLATDPANEEEELGDLMFYTIALLESYKIPIYSLSSIYEVVSPSPCLLDVWLTVANKSLDATKREVFYRQDEMKLTSPRLEMTQSIARALGYNVGLTTANSCLHALQHVNRLVTNNIQKLLKRYPTLTFTTEDSYNRLDKLDEVQSNPTGA